MRFDLKSTIELIESEHPLHAGNLIIVTALFMVQKEKGAAPIGKIPYRGISKVP